MRFRLKIFSVIILVIFCGCTSSPKVPILVDTHGEAEIDILKQPNLQERRPAFDWKFWQTTALNIFSRKIKNLDRDMIVFHYKMASPVLGYKGNMESLIEQTFSRTNFWNLQLVMSNDDAAVGPGMYFAIDPTSSRVYGGESPLLLVSKIKSPSNILDATSKISDVEVSDLVKNSKKLLCGDTYSLETKKTLGEAIALFRNSETENCRIFIVNILNSLQVQAILYNFFASPISDCRIRSQAINVIDPSLIKPIAFFTDTNSSDSENFRQFVFELYTQNQMELHERQIDSKPAPKTLLRANQIGTNRDFKNWKNQFIYSCGVVRSTEITDE